jgi:hypothetical protein
MANSLPSLAHHVFFWLKNPDSDEDRQQLIEGIKSLAAIEGVQALHIGLPASTEIRDVIDNSYSVTELIFFDSEEAEQHYQQHPIHQKFIEKHAHLWNQVKVYDSIAV